jgi:hypothetical protein
MLERRRSSRVPIRIPVQVSTSEADGGLRDTAAEAVSVSRCGALLRASFLPALGSRVMVLHGISHEEREFRVIRVSRVREGGLFEIGVEILYPERNFWGLRFPGES